MHVLSYDMLYNKVKLTVLNVWTHWYL